MQTVFTEKFRIPEELALPDCSLAIAIRYVRPEPANRWFIALVSNGREAKGLREIYDFNEVTTSHYRCTPQPVEKLAAYLTYYGFFDAHSYDHQHQEEIIGSGTGIDLFMNQHDCGEKWLKFWDASMSPDRRTRRFVKHLEKITKTLAYDMSNWLARNSKVSW